MQDIKEASQIAFNSGDGRKYRVVTVNGELVEMTGVMSGGGRAKKGAMGAQVVEEITDAQIEDVSKKLITAEQAHKRASDEVNKIE